ncbi:hypothetical protein L218DRAFT_191697 [Marasmius fiardii PR-910]|nr:hypothetical protein L218DRAFT_191697 [Marasmius fiardii PR-910]
MTSYLRSIFGSSKSSEGRSKSHSRSRSVPTIQTNGTPAPLPPNPIYTSTIPSPTTCSPTRPSPLRYNTYDASTMKNLKHHNRTGSSGSASASARSASGTVSYRSGDKYFPYPIYTPSSTHSRSNSNSSIYPSSVSSHQSHCSYTQSQQSHHSQQRTTYPPRTSSSGSVASRPALKQNHTWHAGHKQDGPRPHVSFVNPKRPKPLNMHPLLASSPHNRAPISYDVMFSPTSSTIVDRNTRTAVPSHTLGQPCTDPPTLGKLVLRSDKFPWALVVHAGTATNGASGGGGGGAAVPVRSPAKFYIAGGSSSSSGSSPNSLSAHARVTNLDLLHALYSTLSARVTKEEWDALGSGSRAQRKVTKAYERRCKVLGGGWDQGVKRIDWLCERTRLIGVEVDKAASDTGVAKLVFGKP